MHAKYLEKRQQILDNAERDLANLKAFVEAFPTIWDTADRLEEDHPILSETFVSDYWGGTFRLTVRDLDGFKGEALVNLLFAVEETFKVEFNMTDYPASSKKDFTASVAWNDETEPHTLSIIVEAYLKADAADCRRVIVGETVETVRRPTYKLICNDSEVPA